MARVPTPQSQAKKIDSIRRGQVYVCSFDPSVGHEIRKTRPALVIQNDIGNRYSSFTIVAASTSTVSHVPYPVEVIIEPTDGNGLTVRSSIRLDQIRTVDRQRLVRLLGVVDSSTMTKVDQAIQISLGLVRL
jgi:mRNA interferase MazF